MTNSRKLLISQYENLKSQLSPDHEKLVSDFFREHSDLLDQLYQDRKNIVAEILEKHEEEKRTLSENTLDTLEQLLYSFLLAIRSLDMEPISNSAKNYLHSLKDTIVHQLDQLKQVTLNLYPTGMHDLGPVGSIKSYYETLKARDRITTLVEFQGSLQRQPQKLELQLFRFIQYLLLIIKEPQQFGITFEEKWDRIIVKLKGQNLVPKLIELPEYQFFLQLADSLDCFIDSSLQDELILEIFKFGED